MKYIKKLVGDILAWFADPAIWIYVMLIAVISGFGSGKDYTIPILGCLFAFFLSRIAIAVEKIAEQQTLKR